MYQLRQTLSIAASLTAFLSFLLFLFSFCFPLSRQGVGILLALERKINLFKDTTNQEFIVRLLIKNIDQLRGMFIKFLKEQVRAIEATKVKIKKRKGVIDFMRIFPVSSPYIKVL